MAAKRSLDDRLQLVLLGVMRLSLVIAIVLLVIDGSLEAVLITGLALILSLLPSQLERYLNISFPIEFTVIIVGFVYASIFLGEVGDAYETFWWWDTVLHITSGVVFGFIGFLMVYWPFKRDGLSMSPRLLAWFSFFFAIATGVIWEIFEFAMDGIFGLNMQKNGLNDTMWDLIVNTLGAGLAALLAYRFIKHGQGGWVIERLTKNFTTLNKRKH